MARIKILDRAEMDAEQGRVYDAAKQSSGIVGGPYYAYIRLPKLFEASQDLRESLAKRAAVRGASSRSSISPSRGISTRVIRGLRRCASSLAAGIPQAVIDAINARKTPELSDPREKTCFTVARELLANKGLSDETYAAAEKTMGLKDLVALTAVTGSFSMTCLTANTFGIDPPAENPTPLTP